jgi:hypothetical protein
MCPLLYQTYDTPLLVEGKSVIGAIHGPLEHSKAALLARPVRVMIGSGRYSVIRFVMCRYGVSNANHSP